MVGVRKKINVQVSKIQESKGIEVKKSKNNCRIIWKRVKYSIIFALAFTRQSSLTRRNNKE